MTKISISHGALVFVGDGQKALFLRNSGDEHFPNLAVVHAFAENNPPTHEQGTDRPGRGFKRASTNRRSSMETTDWHKLAKEHFVARVAAAMEQLVRTDDIKAIVIVAPSRTLAELRLTLHPDIKKRISAEVEKDLTKHPVWQIERHLLA
jgi:protein required for attachment to host cells